MAYCSSGTGPPTNGQNIDSQKFARGHRKLSGLHWWPIYTHGQFHQALEAQAQIGWERMLQGYWSHE
jgi:hypothetical protein